MIISAMLSTTTTDLCNKIRGGDVSVRLHSGIISQRRNALQSI